MGLKSLLNRMKKPSTATSLALSATSGCGEAQLFSRQPSSSNSISHLEELELVFKRFDANGDGKISETELGSIITSLGHSTTEEEVRKMIKEVDKDGDGFIDLEEFIELNMRDEDVLGSLKEAFGVFDIDGNGTVSAEELHQVLNTLGDECSVAECRKMISGVDANGDGVINFEEFKIMMDSGSRYHHPHQIEPSTKSEIVRAPQTSGPVEEQIFKIKIMDEAAE